MRKLDNSIVLILRRHVIQDVSNMMRICNKEDRILLWKLTVRELRTRDDNVYAKFGTIERNRDDDFMVMNGSLFRVGSSYNHSLFFA